jgi:hypothetical protein
MAPRRVGHLSSLAFVPGAVKRFRPGQHPRQTTEVRMAFDPDRHYQNCQAAVTQMTSIANITDNILVGYTTHWNALSEALAAIGAGATAALQEIEALGAEGNYNPAYLSMLELASDVLGAEADDLAGELIVDAGDGFEACRDYANNIRDPFNIGTFPELPSVPRRDRYAAANRPRLSQRLLGRLAAGF